MCLLNAHHSRSLKKSFLPSWQFFGPIHLKSSPIALRHSFPHTHTFHNGLHRFHFHRLGRRPQGVQGPGTCLFARAVRIARSPTQKLTKGNNCFLLILLGRGALVAAPCEVLLALDCSSHPTNFFCHPFVVVPGDARGLLFRATASSSLDRLRCRRLFLEFLRQLSAIAKITPVSNLPDPHSRT